MIIFEKGYSAIFNIIIFLLVKEFEIKDFKSFD